MRIAGVGLLSLAVFLSGSSQGPKLEARVVQSTLQDPPRVDTFRLLARPDDRIRRDERGVWTLPEVQIVPRPVPFGELTLAQLHRMLVRHPELLGTASLGKPNRGSLLNAVRLPASPFWVIQSQKHAWGTPALVACLQRAVGAVHDAFPASPPLCIGDLSQAKGGYLHGHRSHQSGLDADIGYYYRGGPAWYVKATRRNLDVPRTWALVRAIVSDCDAEYLFIDLRVQALLRDHADKLGEDPEWLDALFSKGRYKPGIIRHTWGHQTHIHVRVRDPRAQSLGERIAEAKRWARTRGPTQPSRWSSSE